MANMLSDSQPFDSFLAGAADAGPEYTATENPAVIHAPTGAAADATTTASATPATPLSEGLLTDLAPSSAHRPMTRKTTVQSVSAADKPGSPSTPAGRRASARRVDVPTFEYFGLAGPPANNKETTAPMALRTANNLVKLADIVGTLDARFGQLEKAVERIETENTIRSVARPRETNEGPVGDMHTASNSPRPSANGSIDSIDSIEALGDRVEEAEKHLEALEDRLSGLEDRTTEAEPQAAFSLIELSNAVGKQFKTITADRDTLKGEIDYNAAEQHKINKKNSTTVANLQTTIRALEATIARLELAPTPGLLASRRVHSRSRSPSDDFRAKRARPTSAIEDPAAIVIVGPVNLNPSLTPKEMLQLCVDFVLPGYLLPEPGSYEVRLDAMQANHLRITMGVQAEARALMLAWSKVNHPTIKMTAGGDGETYTAGMASISGHRNHGRDGNRDTGRGSSSRRY